MDDLDRTIVNQFQGGFPISERPFADAAARIDVDEDTLIARVDALIRAGVLSRFGPMYNAELLGGAVALAAMCVPQGRFDAVAALVNAHPEVAHNYARDHALNMWFVIATERPERVAEVITAIKSETGLEVYSMPKIEEFFIGLRLEA